MLRGYAQGRRSRAPQLQVLGWGGCRERVPLEMDLLYQALGVAKHKFLVGGWWCLSVPMRQPRPQWGSARCLPAASQGRQAARPHHPTTHHACSHQLLHPEKAPGVQAGNRPATTRKEMGLEPPTAPRMSLVLTRGPALSHPTCTARSVPALRSCFSPPGRHRTHSGLATGGSGTTHHLPDATGIPSSSSSSHLQPSPTAALTPLAKRLYFHPASPLVQEIQNMKK